MCCIMALSFKKPVKWVNRVWINFAHVQTWTIFKVLNSPFSQSPNCPLFRRQLIYGLLICGIHSKLCGLVRFTCCIMYRCTVDTVSFIHLCFELLVSSLGCLCTYSFRLPISWPQLHRDCLLPNINLMIPHDDCLFPNVNLMIPQQDCLFPTANLMIPHQDCLFPNVNLTIPHQDCLFSNINLMILR